MKIYHIHEVLNYLKEIAEPVKLDKFKESVKAQFGNDCKFESCSDSLIGLDEVLSFLFSRNKIVIKGEMVALKEDLHMCDDHS